MVIQKFGLAYRTSILVLFNPVAFKTYYNVVTKASTEGADNVLFHISAFSH